MRNTTTSKNSIMPGFHSVYWFLIWGALRIKWATADLTDVNPVVLNHYRGPHGSLISRAVWTPKGG